MKILQIKDMTSSIASNISNAFIDFSQMTCSVVAVITDQYRDGEQVVGYGFNSNGRYGVSGLLRERFLPRINLASPDDLLNDSADNLDPFKIWNILMQNEKPGGHGERSVAVGTIDMAIWDAVSKIAEKPLSQFLADYFNGGNADTSVFVYAAGGYYYPGKNVLALQDELRAYKDLGYKVLKMKIGGASLKEDMDRIEAALKISGEGNLCVDANGRFNIETALAYGKELKQYNLFWYEEPGDPLDFYLQCCLAEEYGYPLATGENLFSHQDARNLLRYGGMRADRDWLQFDCALSYGLVEYLRILDILKEFGWSKRRVVPHGGHQMSLNMAAGLQLGGNESYPHVFKPFCGFADGFQVEDSLVKLPNIPGIGFEAKSELFSVMRRLLE